MKLKEVSKEELFRCSYGCAGCASVLAVRLTLKVLGRKSVFVVPANCISTVSCYYPQAPFFVPMTVMAFAATAAACSGISAGFKRRGREDIHVVGFSGDGGTADIGIQALSGAIDCGNKFIYICYDNEAYMNTGIQRSGLTPYGATTTTTPSPCFENKPKKDMLRIVAAHDIPYAATACISYPLDFMQKVEKASQVNGPTYIHILVPCPTGWGFAPDLAIEIGRMAVESGMWNLTEFENGEFRTTYRPRRKRPVSEYFEVQTRFHHLSAEEIAAIQRQIDRKQVS
ncbi:MAG: thiamine pyrophosphate-dependent enzyme [Dehalococcoidales bacterium]